MLVHTLMLSFLDRAEGRGKFENASLVRDGFLTMMNESQGAMQMRVNMGDQVNPDNYDLIVVTSHADRARLTEYLNHPAYVELSRFYKPLVASEAVIDYQATAFGD